MPKIRRKLRLFEAMPFIFVYTGFEKIKAVK